MHIISHDSPCYYLTSVTRDRLPVFGTEKIKVVACNALNTLRIKIPSEREWWPIPISTFGLVSDVGRVNF
jgi:hypothetical protein